MLKDLESKQLTMEKLNRRKLIIGSGLGLAGVALGYELVRRRLVNDRPIELPVGFYDHPVVPVIDAHCHISQAMHADFQAVMDRNQVRFAISHGYWKGIDHDVAAVSDIRTNHSSRYAAFYAPRWGCADITTDYLKSKNPVTVTDAYLHSTLPAELQRFMEAGGPHAIGLKLWRDIGARVYDTNGHLLQLTDPRFTPVLTLAQSLSAVVSIHCCGTCQQTRDALLARYPEIRFVLCHWGSAGSNLASLRQTLERYPNVLVDTSPASGWPTSKGLTQQETRDFYLRFQDRLAFGTDFVELNRTQCCDESWWDCLYHSFWRYHQTADVDFSLNGCSLGRWSGVGLNQAVLRKLYWQNAYQFYKLSRIIPDLPEPPGEVTTG